MNILYATPKSGSGNDVYFERLAEAMARLNINGKLALYPYNNIDLIKFSKPPRNFYEEHLSYDIIHSNDWYGFAFKLKNKPLIISVLHIIPEPYKQPWLSPLQKLYYSNGLKQVAKSLEIADFVIAISKSTENELKKWWGKPINIQTIHCSVDTEIFKPFQVNSPDFKDKIKLLFVGNLTKRKGADLLPRIMSKLDERFVLFYTTGLRTKKQVFPDKRMLPIGKVSLNKIVEMYNTCDMLVMPSRLEGFGYSALEAMACGKPVITTNCSSLPELVDNRKGGFLCEPDNVEDFANKIKFLARDKKMRQDMGKYNREKVLQQFTLLKMGKEYEKVYKEILNV